MSKILHASDLHFGKANAQMVESFFHEIERQKPDLVVLSGDFTQTGSLAEFKQAAEFISRISAPVFTVPGNHDIPRFDLMQRFFDPMKNYRERIAPLQDTVYEDDTGFLVGINTARPVLPHWNWANGMVSQDQIQFVYNQFRYAPVEKARILVCHHPLLTLTGAPIDTIVWGSTDLLRVLEHNTVDVVLTGHIHHAAVLAHEEIKGPVMVGASSATSTRLRSQANGYNLIRVEKETIEIDLIHWSGSVHEVFESLTIPRVPRVPPSEDQ